ncbi:MAG: DUF4424 family protein [Snodgrassella sp.]|nr:DUF4424 family protein [Snodgrassella sp.]
MHKNIFCFGIVFFSFVATANDSTGYASTGGINYIKNHHISMETEDLYISKDKINVAYQFKNLTNRDITETILFPFPALDGMDGDFADTEGLLNSFQVKVNGKAIKPKRHVNIFFPPKNKAGSKPIDVTVALAACGVSEKLLLNSWKLNDDISEKIAVCPNQELQKLLKYYDDWESEWKIQITYSWQQTFKANAITRVEHHYRPLVGGGINTIQDLNGQLKKNFCIDKNFTQKVFRLHDKADRTPLILTRELSYILTTGANWAKPIGRFTLTIERKPNEVVSLCWDKSLKKINATQFRAVKTNFIPQHDIDIVFTE